MRRGYFWILSAIAMGIVLLSGWQGAMMPPALSPLASASPTIRTTPSPQPTRLSSDYQLVDIQTIAPDIQLEMRYATAKNFLKQAVYPKARCLLRAPVAQALKQAQAQLIAQGYSLKMYDCYRPHSVQQAMWKILPDGRYIANPAWGSKHNRGAAVDLTLVDRSGKALEFPSDFDDFSERSHRNSPTASATANQNVQILTDAMTAQGFTTIATEWWHYDGPDWQKYGVLSQGL